MNKGLKLRRVCTGHYETYAGGYKIVKDAWFNVWSIYHNGKKGKAFTTLKDVKEEIEKMLKEE